MSTQMQTLRTHKLAVYAVVFAVALAVALPAGFFVVVKMIPAPQQLVAEVVPGAVPTVLATPEPTPAPTAAPTPSPTPTPKPEGQLGVPGSCLVLEERYCETGDRVIYGAFVGFKLPPGTLLFAPFDGGKTTGTIPDEKTGAKYAVVNIFISPDGEYISKTLTLYIYPFIDVPNKGLTVKKGEVIGKVSSTTVSEAGDYNLVVGAGITRGSPDTGFVKPFYATLLRR